MNPANLRDGKELSEEGDNAPTQNNATPTNSAAAAAADWEANYNAPRPERSPGFAAQRVVTPSSGSYQPPGTSSIARGEAPRRYGAGEEATAPNISSIDKSTDGGLMSAWGRGLATSGAGSTSTYSELMREQHRSMYNAPAPDIGGAGPLSQLPAAATGNGGNASAGSPAGSSGWEPAAPLLSKASDSYGASTARRRIIFIVPTVPWRLRGRRQRGRRLTRIPLAAGRKRRVRIRRFFHFQPSLARCCAKNIAWGRGD